MSRLRQTAAKRTCLVLGAVLHTTTSGGKLVFFIEARHVLWNSEVSAYWSKRRTPSPYWDSINNFLKLVKRVCNAITSVVCHICLPTLCPPLLILLSFSLALTQQSNTSRSASRVSNPQSNIHQPDMQMINRTMFIFPSVNLQIMNPKPRCAG